MSYVIVHDASPNKQYYTRDLVPSNAAEILLDPVAT